jgi:ribosomal protein L37E
MKPRRLDDEIPPYTRKFDTLRQPTKETNAQQRERLLREYYQRRAPNYPLELIDPRIRGNYLQCPYCGKVRHHNRKIDAVVCTTCEYVWYRGRRYRQKEWDKKWLTRLGRAK